MRLVKNFWLPVGERRHQQAVVLMLQGIIMQGALFYMLRRQLDQSRANIRPGERFDSSSDEAGQRGASVSPASRPKRKLKQIKLIVHIWYKLNLIVILIELMRYLVIELLKLNYFRDYHLLDCFLPGRWRFIERTNKICGRLMFVFLGVFLIYRL